MKLRKLTISEWGWLGIAVYVIAVDTTAWRHEEESMSRVFEQQLESTSGKFLCGLSWAWMTAHLFFKFPLPLQRQTKKYLGGRKS